MDKQIEPAKPRQEGRPPYISQDGQEKLQKEAEKRFRQGNSFTTETFEAAVFEMAKTEARITGKNPYAVEPPAKSTLQLLRAAIVPTTRDNPDIQNQCRKDKCSDILNFMSFAALVEAVDSGDVVIPPELKINFDAVSIPLKDQVQKALVAAQGCRQKAQTTWTRCSYHSRAVQIALRKADHRNERCWWRDWDRCVDRRLQRQSVFEVLGEP